MSFHTWTPTELESNSTDLECDVWRCISRESNKAISKISDSAEDAEILETLIRSSREHSLPKEYLKYDHLIYGPFHYGPLVSLESRFRPLGGVGVFYSAFDFKTALLEQAWHRRNFVKDAVDLGPVKALPLQLFQVSISARIVNTQQRPFSVDKDAWLSSDQYSPTQAFASVATEASMDAIRYASVRNFPDGECLAILNLEAIRTLSPRFVDGNWWLSVDGDSVKLFHDQLLGSGDSFSHTFRKKLMLP